jgi:hypothetical protein
MNSTAVKDIRDRLRFEADANDGGGVTVPGRVAQRDGKVSQDVAWKGHGCIIV